MSNIRAQVAVVCDEGAWFQDSIHQARGVETCGGLAFALLLAYSSGMWVEALFILAVATLVAVYPGRKSS